MTMDTKDDELIISMERFSSELKSVTCDEKVTLTFTSNVTYAHAIKSWDWVNLQQHRTFILIANHPGCGRENSRVPWTVSDVYYDPKNLTVRLNATMKTWEEVAHTYTMDFGHYTPPTPPAVTQNNSSYANQSSVGKRLTIDKELSLNLTHEFPKDLFGAVTQGAFTLVVACPNCTSRGELVLAGHIEATLLGGLKSFKITAKPKGIAVDLTLATTFIGDINIPALSKSKTLTNIGLPGFTIPGVLTLGPSLGVDVGVTLVPGEGAATFTMGTSGTIPDTAIAEVELVGDAPGTFSGWKPTFTAQPMRVDFKIATILEVFSQLNVEVSAQVLGNGMGVDFGMKIPDLKGKAIAKFSPSGGACEGSLQTEAAALEASVGAVLVLSTFVKVATVKTTVKSIPVFAVGDAKTFASVCFPFGPVAASSGGNSTGVNSNSTIVPSGGKSNSTLLRRHRSRHGHYGRG
jgi:hypothetical protein